MRIKLIALFFGGTFGFGFSAAGFNQYDIVHRTLLLQDWDPWLIFASATATALPLLWLLESRGWVTPLGGRISLVRWKIDRDRVLGGMVFGVGWAITGACPGTTSTMVAAGSLLGVVTLAGILAGIYLRDTVVERATAPASQSASEAVALEA